MYTHLSFVLVIRYDDDHEMAPVSDTSVISDKSLQDIGRYNFIGKFLSFLASHVKYGFASFK